MKRYIKSNMLGPKFNIPSDDCIYAITGCIYNYETGVFEMVEDLQAGVSDIVSAAHTVSEYLEDDRVDTVFVNGTIEFDAGKYWTQDEIINKILEET